MSCFKVGDTLPKSAVGGGTSVKVVPPKDPVKGGVQPDVIVQFRPSQSHFGRFGFDWLRLGDSGLKLKQSDVKYTNNIGHHTDAKGNKCKSDSCVLDNVIRFTKEPALAKQLKAIFPPEVDFTNLSKKVTGLDKDFEYRVPVMTLMPKDKKLNPHNVNLVAKLDTLIHHGKKRVKSLRLAYKNAEDEKAAKDVIVVNSMSLPTGSKKAAMSVTSKGILKKTVTLYVYADKCHQPCGAVKILRNDKVKQATTIYVGTETLINSDPMRQPTPAIDKMKLREKLAQALINIELVEFGDLIQAVNPVYYKSMKKTGLLDMKGKFKSSHLTTYIHPKSKKTLNALNFDAWNKTNGSLLDAFEKELKVALKRSSFPKNFFRMYFFNEECVSAKWGFNPGGGGSVGVARSFFKKTNGSNVGVLAHEVGHNLNLRHTFSPKSTVTYKHTSTDNIMDYTHIDIVFYYWQWKIMNEGVK